MNISNQSPPPSPNIRNIALDMILTLITFGLFNIYVQAKQINAVNQMLGQKKYNFFKWLILTLLTCTLYHIYHEYIMHKDICVVRGDPDSHEPLVSLILAGAGVWIVADAIQQYSINKFYGSNSL